MRALKAFAVGAGILGFWAAPTTASAASTADLSVVSIVGQPDPVERGKSVTWTIKVKNLGPGEATGVEMGALFGSDAHPLSAESSQGTCSHSPPPAGGFFSVYFWMGSIPSGGTVTATIIAQEFGGDGSLSVTVFSTSRDPVQRNNKAVGDVDVMGGHRPTALPLGTFCAPVGGAATGGGGTAADVPTGVISLVLLIATALLSAVARWLKR